jgi:N-ethylmaleimide reductase
MASLFDELQLGGGSTIKLKHRISLAPLTRQRASEPAMAPRQMNVEYYRQRASPGGLLISEATMISAETCGYHHAPGVWSAAQVEGWKKVCDGVHEKGGYIFCQLWHIGRVAHPSWDEHPLLADLAKKGIAMPSVSASNIQKPGKTRNIYPEGSKGPNATPRALDTTEIPRLIADYVHAAECCKRAGFDGVEIHAAHGYLIDQFLNDGTNKRTDQYGGSIENRCRLMLKVIEAIVKVYGAGRVAIRLSPTQEGSMRFVPEGDSDPVALYTHAVSALNSFPLAYLLLTEPRWNGGSDNDIDNDPGFNMPITNSIRYRPLYKGVLMAAGGFTPESAHQTVADGIADVIGFGRWFISNPDLPERIRSGAQLTRYVRSTFYVYTEDGYTDYPNMSGSIGITGKYQLIDADKIGSSLATAKL